MHPRRTHAAYHIVSGDTTDDVEDILDYATTTAYAKDSFLFPDTDLWVPLRENASTLDVSESALVYLQLADATLIAPDQAGGVAVWHLRGTLADGNETGVIDA